MNECIFKLGFIDDENNLLFKEIFKNGEKIKDIHIEVYPENPIESHSPFRLLVRTIEKNVLVSNDGERFILKMNDKLGTYITNILLSDITKCFVQVVDEHCSNLVINVQNIWYRIIVMN